MRIVLWVLQVLLAVQFAWHGWIYVAPPAEMVEMMNAMIGPGFRTFIGVAELLAAVGLILPAATRILPWLTPLAAAGLMIVTASAAVFHLSRGETGNAIFVVVLFVLATFVAYMRWKVYPIASRATIQAPA
jgi:putative oxidoreductase